MTPRSITPRERVASTARAGNKREVRAVGVHDHGRRERARGLRDAGHGARRGRDVRREARGRRAHGARSPAVVRSAGLLRRLLLGARTWRSRIVQTSETASMSGVATEATRRRLARVFARASMPGPAAERREGQADQPGERPAPAAARAARRRASRPWPRRERCSRGRRPTATISTATPPASDGQPGEAPAARETGRRWNGRSRAAHRWGGCARRGARSRTPRAAS